MLQLSKALVNRPVLSIRTSGQIATAIAPIINPNNLKIEGWYCHDRFHKNPVILLSRDVRDIIPQGIVVNDHDVLSEPDELVRLKEILKYKFELINKPVITQSKQKIGKVSDFAAETSAFYIQKLYVAQSIIKSFTGGGLTIDRSQIVEITNRKIVVLDPLQSERASAPIGIPAID